MKLAGPTVCLVSLCTYSALLAQQPTASTTPHTSGVEDSALSRAIELTGQFDQRILTTVYFCLGTLLTIFVVLIGYNWFATAKSHATEMEVLRQELKNAVSSEVKNLNKQLRAEVEKIEKGVLSSTRSKVESEISTLKSTIADLQLESFAAQRDEWLRQGIPANALRAQLRYLKLAHAQGSKWKLNQGFDRFEQILRQIHEEKAIPPGADDIAEITSFVTEAARDNPIIAASIKSQLEKIRST
jgi:hypothetical protein